MNSTQAGQQKVKEKYFEYLMSKYSKKIVNYQGLYDSIPKKEDIDKKNEKENKK